MVLCSGGTTLDCEFFFLGRTTLDCERSTTRLKCGSVDHFWYQNHANFKQLRPLLGISYTGSHSKNRDEVTPPKPIRKSKRQNMMISFKWLYDKSRVKKYKKNYTYDKYIIRYMREMRILCEGRENNPAAHKRCLQSTDL